MNTLRPNPQPAPQSTRVFIATAHAPGAVAILHILGPDAPRLLQQLTHIPHWPVGKLRLVSFAGLDEGLAVLLRAPSSDLASPPIAQLMPHGGTRIVQRLLDHLRALGCASADDLAPHHLYPEASSPLQAHALHTLALAASPRAIDLLLQQPRLWRDWLRQHPSPTLDPAIARALLDRSAILDRLIIPPTVAVLGPPNVGKSTLTNRILGRPASIVADLPGTTRDWVAALAEIDGIQLRWLDTPGLHPTSDPIEQQAIALAQQALAAADVLLALRDPHHPWPTPPHPTHPTPGTPGSPATHGSHGSPGTPGTPGSPHFTASPRTPDLWLLNKADLLAPRNSPTPEPDAASTPEPGLSPNSEFASASSPEFGGSPSPEPSRASAPGPAVAHALGRHPDAPWPISALTGQGLDRLPALLLDHLGLQNLSPEPWAFCPPLRHALATGNLPALHRFAGL